MEDLSVALNQVQAFGLGYAKLNWICKTEDGASVNCCRLDNYVIHSNGTHTECIGHIDSSGSTIADVDIPVLMTAVVISARPVVLESCGDFEDQQVRLMGS